MTIKQNLKNFMTCFCKSTNLHGFKYIPCSNRYKSLIWCIVCKLSVVFCCYLIYLQLGRYYLKRISTTIETTGYPVWKVDFPAVTVCNVNAVYKSNTEKFKQLLKGRINDKNITESFFIDLSNLVIQDETEINTDMNKYYDIITLLNKEGYNSYVLMKELAHPCENLIKVCEWFGKKHDCKDIFEMIITSEGFCCSFNYEGTVTAKGLTKNKVSYGVGAFYGLQIQVDMEESQYISHIHSGINVLIHEKYDYPVMSLHGVSILPGDHLTVTLKPEVIISNREIRELKLSERACLFENEGVSKWSTQYSFYTCTKEEYAKAIVKICGCLPFYLPYSGPSVRFCHLMDSSCLQKNRIIFTNVANSKIKFSGENSGEDIIDEDNESGCYPECDDISYHIHVNNHKPAFHEAAETNIRIYYRSVGITKIGRSLYLTWDTLLASLGGTFGLCLGGSVLSIVEIVYILLINAFKKKRRGAGVTTIYFNELLMKKQDALSRKKKANLIFATNINKHAKNIKVTSRAHKY